MKCLSDSFTASHKTSYMFVGGGLLGGICLASDPINHPTGAKIHQIFVWGKNTPGGNAGHMGAWTDREGRVKNKG